MDLFEKQAEELGHKLHETESNNTADERVDFIKEIGLERLAKFTKAWMRFSQRQELGRRFSCRCAAR